MRLPVKMVTLPLSDSSSAFVTVMLISSKMSEGASVSSSATVPVPAVVLVEVVAESPLLQLPSTAKRTARKNIENIGDDAEGLYGVNQIDAGLNGFICFTWRSINEIGTWHDTILFYEIECLFNLSGFDGLVQSLPNLF